MFAILMAAHFALVLVAIVIVLGVDHGAGTVPFFESRSGLVVFSGWLLIGVSWLLVRSRRTRVFGVGLYIAVTALVPLATPLLPEPHAQIGLLASAIIPVVLSASAFSTRTASLVLATVVALGGVALAASPLSPVPRQIALAELIVVAVTGGLVVVLRRHLAGLERSHVAEALARERAVRVADERYRKLFETITDAIIIVDHDRRIVEVNEGACRQLGYRRDELLELGLEAITVRPAKAMAATIDAALAGKTLLYETRHRRRDGSEVPVELALSSVDFRGDKALLAVARDISERARAEAERERLEAQLQQAMKMESVGRLASGIAHDMNNILTTIGGNLELARLEAAEGSELASYLDNVQHAADSATALMRQLLTFARQRPAAPHDVDPGALLMRMTGLLERLIGQHVRMSIEVAPDVGTIHIDPVLFEQVVMNLAINARDAMPEGGRLTIRVDDTVVDDAFCRAHPPLLPGPCVRLEVSDDGVGIGPDVLPHIFEPFFTTKASDKGTGLGLATSYGAVTQSGGTITVSSELGRGTTFLLYLPRVDRNHEATAAKDDALPRGGETILVVEDDDACRQLTSELLNHLGYKVLVAPDGGAALDLASRHIGEIDLLITDMVMPGMSGRQLADSLVATQPRISVVYTSGYPDSIIHNEDSGQRTRYLGKPYTVRGLADEIRAALDEAPSPNPGPGAGHSEIGGSPQ